MKVSVFRTARFNAAHRVYRKDWSDAQNLEVFGGCAHPNYHGHNYKIEVKITGQVDPATGYVVDLKKVKEVIKQEVVERFDHKNLNLDTTEFKELSPTVEHICLVIWNILRPRIDAHCELTVRVYETERNYAEYWGE